MKEYYNTNQKFKSYVDNYCFKHECTVEEALKHVLVKEVYNQYIVKIEE